MGADRLHPLEWFEQQEGVMTAKEVLIAFHAAFVARDVALS